MSKAARKEEPTVAGAFDKEDINIRWIPVGNLIVKWPSAQRKEKIIAHAKKIAGNFDPDKFGILTVSMADDNGYHHVIDGVHRSTAVKLMWGDDEKVPCQILPTKDPVRAAEIFLGLQSRRPVSPIDNFRVSVQSGNPDSIAINKVVRGLGYRIENNRADGCISAVGALKTVYLRFGPDVLRDALSIIQATWGMSSAAVQKSIITAYGRLVGTHYHQLSYGRTKEVMRKRFPHPDKLTGLVSGVKELTGASSTEVIYKTILDNYNRGLKVGQLDQ